MCVTLTVAVTEKNVLKMTRLMVRASGSALSNSERPVRDEMVTVIGHLLDS